MRDFDQEAAIAVYGKLAGLKSEELEPMPIIRWLDKHLILMMRRFSSYRSNQPGSFDMKEELQLLPQFFYYLRKSWFVKKFATALDEAAYFR